MQYEKLDEKAPVQGARQVTSQDFKQNQQIKTARTVILVLLSLELIFALYYLIENCIELGRSYISSNAPADRTTAGYLIGTVVVAIISVIYLIIFIVMVAKYIRIGILVFACLSIIQFICTLIVLILSIITIVYVANSNDNKSASIALSVVVLVLAILNCIFTILVVIYSFKLAKLLKQQEAYQYV